MSNRTRTRERRKQREKQRQRNRQILILGSVVVIAVVVVVLMILANQPAEAPIPQDLLDRYQGIPQSMNDQGFPVLGSPDAPVQVVEYSSFDCPHCAEFEAGVTPALVDRVKAGDINFTYAPLYGTGGFKTVRARPRRPSVLESRMPSGHITAPSLAGSPYMATRPWPGIAWNQASVR